MVNSMTDPIADILNRIRNAQLAKLPSLEVPFSSLKQELAKILAKEGFIEGVETKERKEKRILELTLKYREGVPAISGLKRISKPGQRIYLNSKKIKKVRGGYGIAILSTPKGLLTNKEARKEKVGGELLCEVW